MRFRLFTKFKKKDSRLIVNDRQVIVLLLLPLTAFFIWGSYDSNLYRLYNSLHASSNSQLEIISGSSESKSDILPKSSEVLPWLINSNLQKNYIAPLKKVIKKIDVPKPPTQSDPSYAEYPTWSQNFGNYDSKVPDPKYWNIDTGPAINSNNEAEYYTNNSANINVSNEGLQLTATQTSEPDGYHYASARIDTQDKKSFLYGRLDITAKVPIGAGVWPAAWLLPANNKYEDLSSSSDIDRYMNGGEIDLIEEVGFDPNTEYGIVHSVSDINNPNGVGDYSTLVVPNGNASFNLYSLLWTPTSITFEVNNNPFYTYTKTNGANYTTWPFNQPFYLILNLALGGSWGGEDTTSFPGNGIDNSALPATFNIKSIYYYPYIGS